MEKWAKGFTLFKRRKRSSLPISERRRQSRIR